MNVNFQKMRVLAILIAVVATAIALLLWGASAYENHNARLEKKALASSERLDRVIDIVEFQPKDVYRLGILGKDGLINHRFFSTSIVSTGSNDLKVRRHLEPELEQDWALIRYEKRDGVLYQILELHIQDARNIRICYQPQ